MKKVCFVTLSRSDYTSLKPVIIAAQQDSEIESYTIAGGSHLLQRFGHSLDQIKEDGIQVNAQVDFLGEDDDSDQDMSKAYAKATSQFVEEFIACKPDFVFILGDRWEMLAATSAAFLLRIPIVHHSGGDLTQGSLDNQTRYALSTLSHIHLVAHKEHEQRLLKMGEEEWRVKTTGEPALSDLVERSKQVKDIRSELGLDTGSRFVLATYHPTTFDKKSFDEQVEIFIEALALVKEDIVLTAPNPDPGSAGVLKRLQEFAASNEKVHFFENLGAKRFYAAMSEASYMIGNSSSGIWEAPSFQLPVVNMGDRQKDRLRSDNVVDVQMDIADIKTAITSASSADFKKSLDGKINPYVQSDTIGLILDSIKKAPARETILAKTLVDPLSR